MNRVTEIVESRYHKNYKNEARCTLLNVGVVKVQVTVASRSQFQSMSSNGVNIVVWFEYATFPDKPACLSHLPNLPQVANSQRQSCQDISSRAWNWKPTTPENNLKLWTWLLPGSCVCWDPTNLASVLQLDQHSAPQGWSWDYNQTGISCSTMIWQLVPQWRHHASILLVSGVYS